jgi:hypothetical protein
VIIGAFIKCVESSCAQLAEEAFFWVGVIEMEKYIVVLLNKSNCYLMSWYCMDRGCNKKMSWEKINGGAKGLLPLPHFNNFFISSCKIIILKFA